MISVRAIPDEAKNHFAKVASVYEPSKASYVARAFDELEALHSLPDNDQYKEALLAPVSDIFDLIPKLVDYLANDLHTLANFGIKVRSKLKEDRKINEFLEEFANLGQRIIGFGTSAVKFSSSKLPDVLHGNGEKKGGYAHMSKKVSQRKFELKFKNFQFKLDNSSTEPAIAKEALDNLQKALPFLNGVFLSDFAANLLAPMNSEHDTRTYNFMTKFFIPIFERGLEMLDQMLMQVVELKDQLPKEPLAKLETSIKRFFPYGRNVFDLRPNSLKFLGAEAYRLKAPVDDLLNEPAEN